MSRPGVVYSREQLLDSVWGHDRAVTDRTVDVYILRLRQKIEPDPANPAFIRAVRGFGYSFNETTIESSSNASAAFSPAPVTLVSKDVSRSRFSFLVAEPNGLGSERETRNEKRETKCPTEPKP